MSQSSTVSYRPTKARFIGEFLLVLLLLNLPFINIPFKWLETFFHELSHALATVATGGKVLAIELYLNGAGLCTSQGGLPFIIGFAGYFGATLFGWWLFVLATQRQAARWNFLFLGGLVLASALFWARDLLTLFILAVVAAIFLLPLYVNADHQKANHWLRMLLRIIGLIVLCNAFNSAFSLFGAPQGDSVFMAQLTPLPALFWIGLWSAFSLYGLARCWQRLSLEQ